MGRVCAQTVAWFEPVQFAPYDASMCQHAHTVTHTFWHRVYLKLACKLYLKCVAQRIGAVHELVVGANLKVVLQAHGVHQLMQVWGRVLPVY